MTLRKFMITTGIILVPALFLLLNSKVQLVKALAEQNNTYLETYSAHLDNSFQATSTASSATGDAVFHVLADGSAIHYDVTLQNETDVIAAHLHCGAVGESGPAVVPLNISNSGGSGEITMSDIAAAGMTCSPNIQTLAHLIQAMREGKVYINVHTTEHPEGDIRGQLSQGEATITIDTTATSTMATTTDMTSDSTDSTSSTSLGTSSSPQATTTTDSTSPTTTNTQTPVSMSGWYYVFVRPNTYSQVPGGEINFTGSHFAPNEQVTIQNRGQVIGTVSTDSSGSFTTDSIRLPFTRGQANYVFTGSASNLPFTVGVTISGSSPWIGLSTYYAPAGSPLTITGHGFGSDEGIAVMYGGNQIGQTTANSNGDFSFTTTIPAGGVGQMMVQAIGSITHTAAEQQLSQSM